MSINARINRIQEWQASNRPPPPESEIELQAREERWIEAANAVAATMSESHRRLLEEEMVELANGGSSASPLVEVFLRHVEQKLTSARPVALPSVVLDVYLADPLALALHDCEDCGFEVPLKRSSRQYPGGGREQIALRIFERCPLCSGRVGYSYFWHKQNGSGV